MKNIFSFTVKLSALMLCVVLMFSCVKDKGLKHTSYYVPVYKTSAEVRASIKADVPQQIENPGKIFVLGNTIFLAEKNKGVHIIDNSNKNKPVLKSFIKIPGNEDVVVVGNTLYADCYIDLFAIDISNLNDVKLIKVLENVFPDGRYKVGYDYASNKIASEWIKRDTVLNIGTEVGENPIIYYMDARGALQSASVNAAGTKSNTGVGGSMAKMTAVGDRLYVLSNNFYGDQRCYLSTFDISIAANIKQTNTTLITENFSSQTETIFPFNNKLFIGSTAGMFMFSVLNKDNPTFLSSFEHVRSCDPVITDGQYAYVTLRSGNMLCWGTTNVLDILDVTDIFNPTLSKEYQLNNPKGLAKDGNILLVCDKGLLIYDATNPVSLNLLNTYGVDEPFDVIALNNWALITAKNGLYQIDFSNPQNIKLLSLFEIKN